MSQVQVQACALAEEPGFCELPFLALGCPAEGFEGALEGA
jgi:hypothetical protein